MTKRLIIFAIIFTTMLNLFGFSQVVKADEPKNIEIKLQGNTTAGKDAKTVELTLSLGAFTGVEENIVLGYTADVEYDESMFSNVAIEGLNGWTATYESQTKKIVGELSTATAKANTNITKITLTLKDGIEGGTSGTFKLNNLNLADDENVDITVNKSITITKEKTQEATPPTTTPTSEEKTPTTPTTTQKTTQTKPTTQATEKKANTTLPKAGIENYIVITLIIVLVMVILTFIRYKTIKIK